MQVLHSWPGDALKPLLSPVLVYVAHAELSLECPRFSYTPGLMWKDKSGINLLEEESCSRSPAACSMCVMISQSESLSHRPLMCPHCLGPFPEFHLLTFPGEILGFSPQSFSSAGCSRGSLGTLLLLSGGINDGWKLILFTKTNIPNSNGLSQLKVAANQLLNIVTEMNI